MSASSACCTLPPVKADYTPKGSYADVAGIKSYTVGPEDSKKSILYVYDIFGFSPQILQGADLLASQGFRVVMPDFLIGNYATAAMFSGSEEGNKQKTDFFSGFPGAIPTQSGPVAKVAKELKAKSSGTVGVIGACWGYKVAVISEGAGEFDAIAGIHPSFAAVDDVEKINVPLALLPSADEDMVVMNKIFDGVEAKNKGNNAFKHFPNSPHGWMAARGDLKSDEGIKEFTEGYELLSKFFKQHL